MSRRERAERKALLVSRSELERMQMSLLAHEIRDRVALPTLPRSRGSGRTGRLAAAVVAVGLPMLGRQRLARWLRFGSLGLTAWRIARQWHGPGGR
ncbi:MAG: hypothetical protein RJA99_1899 [Pseudomonadota bacterium]|jgi:hypothetical protein